MANEADYAAEDVSEDITEDPADDAEEMEAESQETEEYEEEVGRRSPSRRAPRCAGGISAPRSPPSPSQAPEIGKAERQRLRQHELQKKKMLAQMRDQENEAAAHGDVSVGPILHPTSSRPASLLRSLSGRARADGDRGLPSSPPAHASQVKRGEARLQFLLKQAEIFQHFAPSAIEKAKGKDGKK
jgi:hypothetical protein